MAVEIREERVRAGGTFLTTEYVVLEDGREVGRYGTRLRAEERMARLTQGVIGLGHSVWGWEEHDYDAIKKKAEEAAEAIAIDMERRLCEFYSKHHKTD